VEFASWQLLLPVDAGGRVLYLGSAGGDTAIRLALGFEVILVVEPTLEQARATRTRAEALGVGRIRVVSSDSVDLAVRPASVDLAMVEVLDPYPAAPPGASLGGHAGGLRAVLRSIHSALKPGGYICLGIARPPIGPRRTGLSGGLSMGRYRRLLTAINYGDIRVWCAYPDWRDPKFLVECEQPVFDHFLRRFTPSRQDGLRGLARRVLNASRLLK
jgi:SAM-dependent methyltransferase